MRRYPAFQLLNKLHCIYISHFLKINSSIDKHLGCFQVLTVVNILQWTWRCRYLSELLFSLPLDKYLEVELQDHMAALFLTFSGNFILFSTVADPLISIPTNSVYEFPLLYILPKTCLSFMIIVILTRVRGYLTEVLICVSLMISHVECLVMCLSEICMSSLGECLLRSSVHFQSAGFLLSSCMSSLYTLDITQVVI